MPNVIISADSTCDLSPEQREHYQVRSFPFHIEFRGRDHLDNIDITPQVLFDGFYEDKSLPQTGACSPEAYRQHFAELTADGSKVVHFNLGSALSSAYENASAAAADMEGVYVIDGKSLSTGIGLQVLAACRMRDAGMSAADIAREASELHNRSHASFVLDTMEFLAAGGRCPTLVAYLGGKLSCRPGILVDNQSGAMKVGKLYRGKQEKVLERYVSATLARYTLSLIHISMRPQGALIGDIDLRIRFQTGHPKDLRGRILVDVANQGALRSHCLNGHPAFAIVFAIEKRLNARSFHAQVKAERPRKEAELSLIHI